MKIEIRKFLNRIFAPVFLTHIRLKAALEWMLIPLAVDRVKCLDVVCGDRPYEYLFVRGGYAGIDVEYSGRPLSMKQPDQFYDGNEFPFSCDTFDMVISTQVLEHVVSPLGGVLKEMARVCKSGGEVVISFPFVYQEHEVPFDYFRFTRFGIAELLSKAGLSVDTIKRDSSSLDTVAILVNVYIMHNLVPRIRGFGRLYAFLFCLPIQLIAKLLSNILPDRGQLYPNLVVYAKKT